MLQFQQLAKGYGGKLLFEDVSFTMTPGERLGLVGRNGSGKTTLLRLITGEESPDRGRIDRPRRYQVGYLSQHIRFTEKTVLAEASQAIPVNEDGWVEEHRAEAALTGLGFTTVDYTRPPAELSGGFQVRLQLAKVLLSAPNLLLLDEPTNYLDIVSIRWLERFLKGWPGELILITHDRVFMDQVTNHTAIIHRSNIRRIRGTTEKLYEILAKEEEIHEKTRLNEEKYRRQADRFINRFRAKASKASVVQSRIKMLEKRGQLEKLEDEAQLEFKFNAAPFTGSFMVETRELAFRYSEADPLLLSDLHLRVEKGDRVGIIGKNGKGKSTLLNLIAGELTPTSGSVRRHQNLELAHFGQNNIDRLNPSLTVEAEVLSVHPDHDRGAARGICGVMLFSGDDALKKVEVLSGGERARVLLGKLLVSPANLLLLDEPTHHLDLESIDSLIEAIANFSGGVIFVTHDERVLRALATRLVVFDRDEVRLFESGYQDFLDRVGWSDERADSGRPARDQEPTSKKERRRQRAEARKLRSRTVKPLENRVRKLEALIVQLEERAREVKEDLVRAAAAGSAADITALSRELHSLDTDIESHFAELEEKSTQLEEKRREIDALLGDD